jgi:excisionase family DNA binding protein
LTVEWITTTEAAKVSGYHIEYVRRLARNGQIVAKKWGREWMVNRKSFQEYLASEKKPGPKPGSKPSSN